jgi:hypothetical protein
MRAKSKIQKEKFSSQNKNRLIGFKHFLLRENKEGDPSDIKDEKLG